ncbi:MAG: flagellar M-ring protein FliF [Alphaproteobacteria bacterium]|nr:flagellar M-ring protein FliF [Alphaproteobacteria bacterium]
MDSTTTEQAPLSAEISSADDNDAPKSAILQTLNHIGAARLGVMGGVLFLLIMFFVFVSVRVSSPDMRVVFADLSSTDSSLLVTKLDEANIKYEISPDGSQVLVDDKEVAKARLIAAKEGLPNGGTIGYELLDQQSGFGTTNSQEKMNRKRALEGELARTISALDQVKSARVHLVLPERELFSRSTSPASGSVLLSLVRRGGASLGREQIASIQALVSSAVPELKASDVSISDTSGRLLARGGEEEDTLLTVKAEEMRRNYEKRLTRAIEDLVGRAVGVGKVQAIVAADLNFDRVTQNEEIYDPESQVVRSSQLVEESSSERETGNNSVSVENNLPIGGGGDLLLDNGPTAQSNRLEETTNYEVSRLVKNTVKEAGGVNHLSVSVMVDGTYSTNVDGEKVYVPRSDEELSKIENLVRAAIGYNEDRGDTITIETMQFVRLEIEDLSAETQVLGFEKSDLLDAVEIITIGIMGILVILLVLRPMMGKLLESNDSAHRNADDLEAQAALIAGAEAQQALPAPEIGGFQPDEADGDDAMIDMNKVEGKVKASSVRKVEDIVENFPAETVNVLRSWMAQE